MWDSEPVVAPSDFDPFRHCPPGEEAFVVPLQPAETATLPRQPLATAHPRRPRRLNLLEIGLAAGQGFAALDHRADARQARMDGADAAAADAEKAAAALLRATSVGAAGSEHAGKPERHQPATTKPPAPPAPSSPAPTTDGQTASRQQAITALAEQVQATHLERRRLTDELAALEEKETALRRQLVELLGR